MVNGEEQHECWAPFRVARYSTGAVEDSAATIVRGALLQCGGKCKVVREIVLEADGLRVVDHLVGDGCIESAFVFARDVPEADGQIDEVAYAPEFGVYRDSCRIISQPANSPRGLFYVSPATKRQLYNMDKMKLYNAMPISCKHRLSP